MKKSRNIISRDAAQILIPAASSRYMGVSPGKTNWAAKDALYDPFETTTISLLVPEHVPLPTTINLAQSQFSTITAVMCHGL